MSESAIVRALSSCDEDEEEAGEARTVQGEGATVSSGEKKRGTVEKKMDTCVNSHVNLEVF